MSRAVCQSSGDGGEVKTYEAGEADRLLRFLRQIVSDII